jgi:hypothetical protein
MPTMARCCASPLLLVFLAPAAAWGPAGHTIVAHIADSLLAPDVEAVLKNDLGGTSLTDASTWCDDFDHTPAGKWSEALHYINYPGHACSFEWSRDCVKDWCNVGAIVNYTQRIFDKSTSSGDRLIALKFVIHMSGDVHQPLHVASSDDRGGNDINVHYDFSPGDADPKEQKGKLHAIWDTKLVVEDFDEIDDPNGFGPEDGWQKLAQSLKQKLNGEWAKNKESWEQDVASSSDDALRTGLSKVAGETAALGCNYAYVHPDGTTTIQDGDTLGRDYYEHAKPVVEMQLARGGARLAQLLKDALRASQRAANELLV